MTVAAWPPRAADDPAGDAPALSPRKEDDNGNGTGNDHDDDLRISDRETFAGLLRKTLAFARGHRSLNVVGAAALVLLLNWAVQQPVEWVLLVGYSLVILLRAQRLGVSTLLLYVLGLSLGDYLVSTYLPPDLTTTAASLLVNAFVVVQLHGINLRGMLLLAILLLIVLRYPTPVSVQLRPIAVHCTVFGASWLLFAVLSAVHDSIDDVLQFLGLALPPLPTVIVHELTPTSLKVWWSYRPRDAKLLAHYVVEINGVERVELGVSQSSTVVKDLLPSERYVVRVGAVYPSLSTVIFSFPIVVQTPLGGATPTSDEIDPDTIDSGRGSTDSWPDSAESGADAGAGSERDKPAPTDDSEQASPVEPKPMIDAQALQEMQTSLRQLQQQRLNSETLIRELQIQYYAEVAALEEEVQKFREIKKSEDNPKTKLKHTVKSLEEAKARVDFTRAKLEKELRSEDEVQRGLHEELERLEREQAVAAGALTEAAHKHDAITEQHQAERQALKTRMEAARAATVEDGRRLAQARERLQSCERETLPVKDRVLTERAVLSSLLQRVAGTHTRQQERDKHLEALMAQHQKLVDESRMIQEMLHEETQRKMSLMLELSAARKKREQEQSRHFSSALTPMLPSLHAPPMHAAAPAMPLQHAPEPRPAFATLEDARYTPTSASASPGSRKSLSPMSSSSRMDMGGFANPWAPSHIPPEITRRLNFSQTPSISAPSILSGAGLGGVVDGDYDLELASSDALPAYLDDSPAASPRPAVPAPAPSTGAAAPSAAPAAPSGGLFGAFGW